MTRPFSVFLAMLLPLLLVPAGSAVAQPGCARVVVVTLPGVTWEDVKEHRPPHIMDVLDEGASGSVAMRTNSARIVYGSGFLTIGAGTRADAPRFAGGVDPARPGALDEELSDAASVRFLRDVGVGAWPEIRELAASSDYRSEPGALGSALGTAHRAIAIGNADPGAPAPAPAGDGRWVLLGAMDRTGTVPLAATGQDLLTRDPSAPYGIRTDAAALARALDTALAIECSTLVIDQGDLLRADLAARAGPGGGARPGFAAALAATDQVVGHAARSLDPSRDLLLVVAPNPPRAVREVQLGVAIARGDGFEGGARLTSASTREPGIVTLPDVAPTVLQHLGIERPATMVGRPWIAVPGEGGADARVSEGVRLNDESMFTTRTKAGISTGFVIFQILVYLVAILLMWERERKDRVGVGRARGWLQAGGLAIVAFPLSTYLANPLPGHELGVPLFVTSLLAIDAALVVVALVGLKDPLTRLLALSAATVTVMIVDLLVSGGLQLNATFGNEPIVAGRFSGLGNLAFSILGTTSLMTGALVIHHWPRSRNVFVAVALLFGITIYADGAPSLGSDVGGVIALVPALGMTLLLLAGGRPDLRVWFVAGAVTVAALGAFLALDLARAPEERTHLARLFEDVRTRGWDLFVETVGRKIRTNLRVFRSTIWTYLVPPALAVMAWLLLRPRGRWHRLAVEYPKLRAGLIGGLILAIVGYAFNDSGIVIPAMVLSFLAPMSLLIHLELEDDRAEPAHP